MADLKQQRQSARDDDADEDSDNEPSRARVTPAQEASPRRGSHAGNSSKAKKRGDGHKNRKAFYNADGTASVAVPEVVASSRSSFRGGGTASSSPRSAAVPQVDYYGDSVPPSAALDLTLHHDVVQEGLLTSSHASNPDQIPFASPVFMLDREPHLQPNEFWRLWKQLETTYALH